MPKMLFSNGASAVLAVSIIGTDTTVQVQSGYGAFFPLPSGGNWFMLTLEDVDGNIEIMQCTARTGDLLTVVRGQEGTLAQAFTNTTTRCELRDTKGTMERFLQRSGDALGGDLSLGGFSLTAPGSIGDGVTIPKASLFSTGMIMMWSGSILSIPSGWALCNGSNGTPDLRDRFVLGAGGATPPGTAGGGGPATVTVNAGGGHTHTGGATTLTVAQMPAHTHGVYYRGSEASSGGQDVDFVSNVDTPGVDGTVTSASVGGGQPHSHTLDAVADHTHTATAATEYPPFYALCFIMFTGATTLIVEEEEVEEEPPPAPRLP